MSNKASQEFMLIFVQILETVSLMSGVIHCSDLEITSELTLKLWVTHNDG